MVFDDFIIFPMNSYVILAPPFINQWFLWVLKMMIRIPTDLYFCCVKDLSQNMFYLLFFFKGCAGTLGRFSGTFDG